MVAVDNSCHLDQVLEHIGDLPVIPAVVQDVLRVTEDPDSSVSDLCAVIERDPGLTARILRISNSAYYGLRKYVGNLELALVILGMREARNLVLGAGVAETLHSGEYKETVPGFWLHSNVTAGYAKALINTLRISDKGEAFVSGLLHDIGKLILNHEYPETYTIMVKETSSSTSILLMERDRFGFTHADVGAALARRWSFPQALVDALWLHHHDPERPLNESKDPKLTAVVRLANCMASEASRGGSFEYIDKPEDNEIWNALGVSKDERNTIPGMVYMAVNGVIASS